jgi:beta-glucosidase
MSDSVQSIIAKMSLEEKAALCTGASAWTTVPFEHLGVPEMVVSDGPHGLRHVADPHGLAEQSVPSTCFPTASLTAATWDVDLIHKMGEALAEECIALDVDVILGPGTNMKRSPLCGRNFEYFSEDPFLAGEMAASYIQGMQGKGVGTSLKHFAANNQEFQRFTINADVDERTLREIYLTAFEKAVRQGKPWTVMCSYNKINGAYGSESYHQLTEILKGEWGFEGFVVSDWGAVHDRVKALKAGLDLEMPGPMEQRVKAVVDAVRAGELDEAVLNESVRRILTVVFKSKQTAKKGSFDVDAHHEMAHQIASQGMVLLKNNGILPFKGLNSLAVIGDSAKNPHFQGGGSSHINPTKVAVPFDELQAQAGSAKLTYAQGYPADPTFKQELIDEAVTAAKAAEAAVLFIALPTYIESEGYDRTNLDLTAQQVALIQAVTKVQPNTVVVLNNGAPVVMSEWIDGTAAVLEAYMMGQAGGKAVVDILFGKVNPSGKLAETFPLKLEDTPAVINWPGGAGTVRYGENLFIGYRYYDAKKMPVLFPFGFGLSYTTFSYSNARVSKKVFKDTEFLTVMVDVTNTGKMAGKEIVQVYVHDPLSRLVRPEKELKGFAKVDLQPGETKTVSIKLDFRSFAYYHPAYKQWITEDGEFDLLIGTSSADIRQKIAVTLESSIQLPCLLNRESTIREWMEDPRGKVVFDSFYKEIEAGTRMTYTNEGEETAQAPMGLDLMEMMKDMPLEGVLLFIRGALKVSAEEKVQELLNLVHSQE